MSSLLLHGPGDRIQQLSKYLRYYAHLAANNGVLPSHAEDLNFDVATAFLIENKYYSADLQLHLHPLPAAGTTSPFAIHHFEGILLVPKHNEVKSNFKF